MDMSGDNDDSKYDFNTSQSLSDDDIGDDDDSRDAALAIEENLMKEEAPSDFSNLEKSVTFSDHIDVKQDSLSLDHEIILPEAAYHRQASFENKDKKKDIIKSRKELEEEEREKMQPISNTDNDTWLNDGYDQILQEKCDELLLSYKMSPEKIKVVSDKSVGQHGNPTYDKYRAQRLTASMFGVVCKRRADTSCDSQVKQCLYPRKFTTKYVEYGKKNEIVAIELFEKEKGLKVRPSGLYIDKEFGYLGASPDGIVEGEESIVEVKCTLSLVEKNLNYIEAAQKIGHFCLQYNETTNTVSLKRNHQYYFQIQGQLHISNRDKCYFIVFRDEKSPLHIEEIERDDEFWKDKMEVQLTRFFKTCVVPEIVLKRVDKGLKCVDPEWIQDAQLVKLAESLEKTTL